MKELMQIPEVAHLTLVSQLKAQIQDKIGIFQDQQHLFAPGCEAEFEDRNTLLDCNLAVEDSPKLLLTVSPPSHEHCVTVSVKNMLSGKLVYGPNALHKLTSMADLCNIALKGSRVSFWVGDRKLDESDRLDTFGDNVEVDFLLIRGVRFSEDVEFVESHCVTGSLKNRLSGKLSFLSRLYQRLQGVRSS